MISVLLSRLVLLVFGTLYPSYASYKTVKTKNVKEYVRWMMYWIVFALYTLVEIFADIFIAFWFPFYYELKILFVLWLICPATRGSTYMFRKVINPHLSQHEKMIDSYIASLWDNGYDVARKIGARGVDYLIEMLSELLNKSHITAINLLPKVSEIAQTDAVVENCDQTEEPKRLEENALDDEEFDMLLMENPELYNDQAPHLKNAEEKNQLPDTDSELDDVSLVTNRPLKINTRSKTKASAVKERRRKVVK